MSLIYFFSLMVGRKLLSLSVGSYGLNQCANKGGRDIRARQTHKKGEVKPFCLGIGYDFKHEVCSINSDFL